jgi:glucose/mannose-6-phosphate isomerase
MNLDSQSTYKKLDKHFVGESIKLLPEQIAQVLTDSAAIKIPEEYKKCSKILVNGMGGSSLGAYMVKAIFAKELKVPFNVEPGYVLPNYIDKNTLYIIVSYSGTTEEPISTYEEAKKRGAKIMAIAENKPDSELCKIVKKDNLPAYIFTPKNNPSNQPRLGVGYTAFGIIALLLRAGFLNIKEPDIKNYLVGMKKKNKQWQATTLTANNPIKKLALTLHNKTPILIGAEHLAGNLHALRNQINECAKLFSSYLILPDLNHYAMEGLVNPKTNKKNLVFLFFDSTLYHPRVQLRAKLTKQVVNKNGIKIISYNLKGATKSEQALEMLQFGSWLSYYLGMLDNVDPVKIPWVDWFKKELK